MSIRNLVKTSIGVLGISLFLTAPVHAAEKGVSLGDNVNVRSGANAEAEVVTTIQAGAVTTVFDLNNGWFEVELEDGTEGFVNAELIKLDAIEGTVTIDDISVRDEASQQGLLIGKLNKDDIVTATGIDGNWLQIEFNGSEAYVFNEYVSADKKDFLTDLRANEVANQDNLIMITAENGVTFRAGRSTGSGNLGTFAKNETVQLLSKHGDWVKVVHKGQRGYVHNDFVEVITKAQHASMNNSKGKQVVDYATKFTGTPYVWGGTNLNSGVDCSGFVYAVFRDHGIGLNRTSRDMASHGSTISKGELQEGDLVFFRTGGSSRINHVGIYIGGSKFVHASSGKVRAVTVSDLNSAYYTNAYYTARRIL